MVLGQLHPRKIAPNPTPNPNHNPNLTLTGGSFPRGQLSGNLEKHLHDKRVYKEVKFNKNILTGLVEKRNNIFNCLCSHRLISESELKYFTYNFKKATNLDKVYFLPKIHRRLANILGRPVISNCVTPTEKVSEYPDFLLKPVMQDGWSYIKDNGDFFKKIKRLGKTPEGGILVVADVVGLFPIFLTIWVCSL